MTAFTDLLSTHLREARIIATFNDDEEIVEFYLKVERIRCYAQVTTNAEPCTEVRLWEEHDNGDNSVSLKFVQGYRIANVNDMQAAASSIAQHVINKHRTGAM